MYQAGLGVLTFLSRRVVATRKSDRIFKNGWSKATKSSRTKKRKTVAVLETTWRKTDDNKPKGKGVARRWKRVKLIGNGGKVTRKSGDKIKQEVERTEQKHWKRKENELIQQ